MTPSQIISADIQAHGKDPQADLQAIAQAVQAKKGVVFSEGNTAIFLLNIGNGAAEAHLYTQDSPIKVARALLDFIKKAQTAGIKVVYGTEDVPQLQQLVSNLGLQASPSDNPKYKWMVRL